ncbi:hypothetical protein I4Z71_003372 [Salmonella enterica subsp. enterica serovar Grumpensis]|nr:hypothetical protein [Salmonella enterica subsp. enterica serovar Grumpensis]
MSILANAVAECTQNNAIDFNFEDHEIRTVLRNGEPWFVASDVCGALNLTNASKSVSSLDDDEKYLFNGDSNFKLGSAGNGPQAIFLAGSSNPVRLTTQIPAKFDKSAKAITY